MAIDGETHSFVKSLLDKPPPQDKYLSLKNAILKAHSETEQRRTQHLASMTLGDLRPSQLFAKMRDIYRGDMDHVVIRNLFLARMPSTTGKF